MADNNAGKISRDILLLVSSGAATALLLFFIFWFRKLVRRIRSVLNGSLACYPVRREAEQNREIYNELVELRAVTDADRSYVFRFHNGMEFLPSHPAWKLTCTHEVVKHGVTYESAALQSILVSLLPNIIGPVLTGSTSSAGITVPECKECTFKTQCLKKNKRVVVIQTDEMPSSYCRFHLESQNIKTAVLCGLARDGAVFGMIGVDFCGTKLGTDKTKDIIQRVCRATDKIQFHLQFKRAPIDLPIPDRPITLPNIR